MKTLTDLRYTMTSPCVVALGCFDGVHLGHSAVIGQAVEIAKSLSLPSLVWSFVEPPRRFYAPSSTPLITDAAEKERLISALGADILLSVRFDGEIASVTAEDFFSEYILRRLRAAHIVCGYNFTFGKGGLGNTELLEKLCRENSIGFTAIPSVKIDGTPVSSSAIRALLSRGELKEAEKYLGHPYSITATVVDGKHLGHELGFPTINQSFKDGLSPLALGVYLTRASFDEGHYFGITNVGTRPTVGGEGIVAETNIFDYSGYLYGKSVTVEFLRFLRPEMKFASLDDLSAQVHLDIKTAKNLIKNYK